MVSEFVVGIAMRGAEHATGARVASRRAIGLHFHAMGKALRDVPASGEGDGIDRTCGNAGSWHTSGTRVEAERGARRIQFDIDNQRGAKSYPRTVNRMHHD